MADHVEEGTLLRILALDLATRTGFAHSAGPSGSWDLSIRRDESSGMRLIRLCAKLNEIRDAVGVDLVVFEAPRFAGPGYQAVVVQAEMQGIVKLWCDQTANVPYRGYSPSEIKKHATGKGNASKEAVAAAAYEKWQVSMSQDEADARWLLDLAKRDL